MKNTIASVIKPITTTATSSKQRNSKADAFYFVQLVLLVRILPSSCRLTNILHSTYLENLERDILMRKAHLKQPKDTRETDRLFVELKALEWLQRQVRRKSRCSMLCCNLCKRVRIRGHNNSPYKLDMKYCQKC
jgi:hypothetical protein